jgi:hypothetical protein
MNATFQTRWVPAVSTGPVTPSLRTAQGVRSIPQVFRERLTSPADFQSRILTRDTDHAGLDQNSLWSPRRLAVIVGAVIAAAGLGWAGFAIWQFYDAVARLTTFAQSAAV